MVLTSAVVAIATQAVFADDVFHVAPHGSDDSPGSLHAPLATLASCVGKLKNAGDECQLASGTYTEDTVKISGVSGTQSKPVVIGAAQGAHVVIDGTSEVKAEWKATKNGIWETTLPEGEEVTQLWVDGEMQTPARWPNALWKDKSCFDWATWSKFDSSAEWSPAKAPPNTPDPLPFTDAGELAKSGLDITGAMFVGTIAHMDTFVGQVTSQDKSNKNQFDVQMHVNGFGNTKVGNSLYFLEGLPAFIDQPTEWSYNSKTRVLSLKTADGKSPASRKVVRKSQVYAMNITDAKYITLKDMTFFGTTINAQGGIDGLSLESLNFQFPSFSRRMVGEIHTASPTVVSDKGSSFNFFNNTWFGADGPTLRYSGTKPTFVNNLWQNNDWSAADDDGHTGLGGWILDASGGEGDHFERNSFVDNGPSVAYTCGRSSNVFLNRLTGESDIQNDGALIQVRSGAARSTVINQNWMYNSAKGFRLDSGSNSEFVKDEIDNKITKNVVMRTNGMMLKNDENTYRANLALWGPSHSHLSPTDTVFRVDAGRFATENTHSVTESNVANSWTTPIRGTTAKGAENVLDKNVDQQLRDPDNLDFRPREGSQVAEAGAGPYSLKESATTYWIPGRQEWRAGTPVPPHGTKSAKADLDLMFLAAYGCESHEVFFGRSASSLKSLGKLGSGQNVKTPSTSALSPGQYYWRVDALCGSTIVGEVWEFTVPNTQVLV